MGIGGAGAIESRSLFLCSSIGVFMAQMRICFFGDSFVSGAFDPECLGWAGRIAARARIRGHDVSLYNLGIRGETSLQLAKRWRAEAERRQAPAQEGRLVFEFGVNDAREIDGKRQLELAQSLAAAREILVSAASWKATLMVGPPPGADTARNGRVKEISASLGGLCGEIMVSYFDSFTQLLARPSFIADCKAVDGTHPSSIGYAEWANLIDGWHAWREWLP
jgi:acyl-CoA thioesterase-1